MSELVQISKVGAGYAHVKGTDYRCIDCWKFISKRQKCAELREQDTVRANGYCIQWSFGPEVAGLKPMGAYTPAEVGYGEDPRGTLCSRCQNFKQVWARNFRRAWFGCRIVRGVIARGACCNNQKPA